MRRDNSRRVRDGVLEVIAGTHRAGVRPIKCADDESGFVFHSMGLARPRLPVALYPKRRAFFSFAGPVRQTKRTATSHRNSPGGQFLRNTTKRSDAGLLDLIDDRCDIERLSLRGGLPGLQGGLPVLVGRETPRSRRASYRVPWRPSALPSSVRKSSYARLGRYKP